MIRSKIALLYHLIYGVELEKQLLLKLKIKLILVVQKKLTVLFIY